MASTKVGDGLVWPVESSNIGMPYPAKSSHVTGVSPYLTVCLYCLVEPKVCPTDRLEQMLKKFGDRLEVQSVHQETTGGVRVTAIPFLMGRRKVCVRHQWCPLLLLSHCKIEPKVQLPL